MGILTGLFVIIPYLGFSLGFVLATLTALLQFGLTIPFFLVLTVYGGAVAGKLCVDAAFGG